MDRFDLQRVEEADLLVQARCLAGENACPPEDVGGPPGYEEFLRAIADPGHELHEDMVKWCDGRFYAGKFDLGGVNRKLRGVRL